MKSARPPRFELTPIALAMRQAGLAVITVSALAPLGALAQVPTGGNVTQGTAVIRNVTPTQQVINQGSNRAVINWQSFSIGQSSSVQFVQPSSSSVVLNRVTGANPSQIFGSLSANGQVFLVNPFGVYFSPTARVDVTGLMATTLNIRDDDFMKGIYSFSRDPLSPANARVLNEGVINAGTGGYVVLAGDYAANRGTIEARGGNVVLASGSRMTLDLQGDGLVKFAVDEKAVSSLAAVENAGTIIADGGRVVMTAAVARDITGTVVNNTGVVQARGTEFRDGSIFLTGSGGDVSSSGKLDASGQRGGQVTVQSTGTTLVSGDINASGSAAKGGTVQVLGERVGLVDSAAINASGATGGGTVLVGGDFQGKNTDVQNAQRTYVAPNATIVADAGQTGDGGKVIVWADGDTRYYGNISARGGTQSGNGGSAEVSGKQVLDYNGQTDLRAPAGRTGTLLLDPNDLTIQTAGVDSVTIVAPGAAFTDTSNVASSILTVGTLQTQLGTADVVVQTGTGGTNLQSGNITVANDVVAPANASSLTLKAHNDVILNAKLNFSASTGGSVTIIADSDAAGGGAISGAGLISRNNGTVSLSAGSGINVTTAAPTISFTNSSGAVNINNSFGAGLTVSGTNSGTIAVAEATGNLTVGAGNINSNNNTISLTANAGTITDTGTITGSTLTTSSKSGTTLNSANAVTGFNATNSTSGDISFSNDTATTLTVTGVNQAATAGAVNITHAGNVNVTGAASTSDGAVSVTANGGSLTVGNTVTAGGTARDVTLKTTGNNDINVNAAVTATGDNITLDSGGAINGGGTLTSSGLALSTTTGSIGSSGTPLALSVDRFEGQAPGSIFVTNSKALIIGGVSGLTGVSTTVPLFGSGISISATDLTVTEAISTALGVGPVTLSADQFAINAGVTGGSVTLQPKTAGTNFTLGFGATGAGLSQAELLNITAGLTRIGSSTSKAGTITFDGNLALTTTQGALSLNSTGAVTQAGGTTISTPRGFAAQTNGASVTLDQPNNNFQTVAIDAGAGNVNLRNDSNFTVATVDGVKGIKGADITLTTGQTRTANLTATDTLDFGAPSGLVVGDRVRITGGGTDFVTTVTAAAGNTATISQNVTTGAIDTSVDTNLLIVAAVGTLKVGDLVTIPGAGQGGVAFTSTIAAIDVANKKITLSSGAFTTVPAGTAVLLGRPATGTAAGVTVTRLPTTGTIASGANTLTVASANGFNNGDRIVVPGAGANGADLLTSITGIAGNVLTLASNAGTDSKDAPIAKPSFIGNPSTTTAGTAGVGTTTVFVASTAGFSVGDAISIAGAGGSSGPHNVTITNVDGGLGTITLSAATVTEVNNGVISHTDQGIAATGTLTLDSKLPGGFTQAGGAVNAATLVLKGSGPYNIGGAGAGNKINTLAADVTGSVAVGTRGALTIGTAGGISGVTTRSVLTVPAGVGGGAAFTDANVALSTNSDNAASGTMLQINQPIIAGAKEPFPAADDPTDPTGAARTGQVLLFLVNDTKATGTGLIEGGLLNLSAEVTKGTFDVTTKVSSLSLSGSKDAKVNNVAYTGKLTALNLGLQDISTSASVTSADNNTSTPGAGTIFTSGLIPDAHAGRKLVITSGTGKDETYSIVSNTATKIVLAGPLTTIPAAGDTFKIGEDKDIRAGNVALRTGGDISVTTANMTGDLAVSAEKADARATFTFLSSSGNNIFIQADRLLVTKALTTPGVNVLLRPFTKTNTVGIESATASGMSHVTITGSVDITVSTVTVNVASAAGFNVGDSITIPGAGPGGANLVTSIASINGNALTLNDVAEASVTNVTVTNNAVGAGGTNYSANTLGQFHQNANITIGGDDTGATFPPTFPVGITGTPWVSGNVFIGADGAVNLGTQNLFVSTSGNITSSNLGPVGNVGLVAGGASGISLANLNSTGANLLFKANKLDMPGAASAYTTAAGVNVTLQPYILTNTVGVQNSVDFHNGALGTTTAGSDVIPISNVLGTVAVGDTINVLGAGPGGADITGATVFGRGAQILLATPAAFDAQNVTVTTNLGFNVTTGSIKAGSNILLVNDASGFTAGGSVSIDTAGAGHGQLNAQISSLGAADAIQLGNVNASTSVTDTHLGKPPQVTINTNYSQDLINKFNATAKITVSGTTTTPAGGNTLSGDIHIGSDATGANPFNIGSRTLTASTTGTVFNHTTTSVSTATSGTSGTVPPSVAWTAGQTPVGGVSTTGGGGSGTPGGGTPGGGTPGGTPGGPGGGTPGGGPPSATPPSTSDPTSGGNPPSGSTPPSTPTPPTPPTTPGTPPITTLPDPTGTPGPDGTTVIGYVPDPDPGPTPPGTPTDPGPPTVVVVTPPDPGVTPPGTPPDPPTVVVVTPPDPGVTPPGTPPDPPTVVVVTPPDPGVTPPGTGTPPDPTVVVVTTPPDPGATPPGTGTPPDPTVVVVTTPPDPGATPPGTGTPPDPTVVVVTTPPDPGATPPGTGTPPDPTVVVVTTPPDPGATPPGTGTPPDPTVVVVTTPPDPGATPPGTGTPPDPTVVVVTTPPDPGATPPGTGTPPDPTVVVTGPPDPTVTPTPPGGPTDPGTLTPGSGPTDPTVVVTGPIDPGITPTPPGGPTDPGTLTPGGGPTDPTTIATGPTGPGGGTPPPGGPTDPGTLTPGGGPTDPTTIATGPTDPGGGTPPGGPSDPVTGTPSGPVASGPTTGGPGGTTTTTTGPDGSTTTTTTTTASNGSTSTTTTVTTPGGSSATTVTSTAPDGTMTTVSASGTTTTVSPNGTTTTVLADGTTTTTSADGTVTSGPATVVASNDSSKSSVECPPGTTAAKSESGSQGAACVADSGAAATATPTATTSSTTAAATTRKSAAPVTQGEPAEVFAARNYGVNIFQAGRRNGPGTPDPGERK